MPHTETLNLSISVTHVTNETVDNSAQEPTQPAAAGAEGGAAAGTTLPLRGFAMVLIAVAVMFGLWALYAFTQDNGSEQAAEDTSQQAEQQAGDANAPEPGTVGADTALLKTARVLKAPVMKEQRVLRTKASLPMLSAKVKDARGHREALAPAMLPRPHH